jgi:integrase/recombinase XerD
LELLRVMNNYMNAKSYSPRSTESYVREMRLLFSHYNHIPPKEITQNDIVDYINFIKVEHGVSRDKCRMTAQSCSFFYKHIFRAEFIVPSAFYPRKEFRLPEILTQEQVIHALNSCTNLKHKLLIGLFYGTGMRMSELKNLKMKDIDRQNAQIKVIAGKGSRDRFTLLPKQLLSEMEQYYWQYRPKVYLFEGQTPTKPMNERSIQHALRQCMKLAGLEQYKFSAHSLRHSFATHLLDQGNDIHTIKELLGHSKIETTMIYLHLQKKKRAALCSPFDYIMTNHD